MKTLFQKSPEEKLSRLKKDFTRNTIPHLFANDKVNTIKHLLSDDAAEYAAYQWKELVSSMSYGEHKKLSEEIIIVSYQSGRFLFIEVKLPENIVEGDPIGMIIVVGPCTNEEALYGEWADDDFSKSTISLYMLSYEDGCAIISLHNGKKFKMLHELDTMSFGLFDDYVHNRHAPSSVSKELLHMVDLDSGSEKMNRAIQSARDTLLDATQRFIAGELEGFSVKFPITDGVNTEHVWLANTHFFEGLFTGEIESDIENVEGFETGQEIEVSFDAVSDWLYLENGKMHGSYTLRAMLSDMHPSVAKQYREILAPVEVKEIY
ncbi:YegJ family protein [Persicirhabdus sediminis]|uniref:DUF2314 domain-containing protein n=1 Tax=Persicirhabdus sediminis TaxID=454144 RepID=A0A8J7SJF2_9BACT|nr:DUF2314 domain-containing protein [Persicirhabdus sediminis]MBK1792105.1 DUF2314 domain-containing protein [Persicirhabdus sediminis]